MKIAYLHQYFVTPEMGGGTRSYELARRLVAAGHEVHMITSEQGAAAQPDGWRDEQIAGINVHWTPVPYSNDMSYRQRIAAFFGFAWRAARRVPQIGADVVFATSTPLTIALPAVRAARRLRVPMVFEVRDLWPAVPIAIGAIRGWPAVSAARWLERFAYRNAAHVVALAPGMRDAVVETGYPRERTSVIPNGADLDTLNAGRDARERLRGAHEWLGQRRMVLFFGTLGLVNGVDYLIRVASHMRGIDPEVRFVILGSGRMESELRTLASELGVLDQSLYMPGRVSKHEVAEWLAACDMSIALFTGPRVIWKDATQNKFFDSLAAGRPVANNFDGWQSRIALDAGCGVILDPDDVEAAARELHGRLTDDDWLADAGRRARQLAETSFNRDEQAAQLEGILRGVVNRSEPGG